MPVFKVRAKELVWEVCYIEADNMYIAEELAKQDELHDWEVIDGSDFELLGIEKVRQWEIPSIRTEITRLDKVE